MSQKTNLLQSLKKNLLIDYNEDELNQKEISLLMDLFGEIYDRKQQGDDEETIKQYIKEEVSKESEKEKIGKAFVYLLKRAEGKYGISGRFFSVAKSACRISDL